MKFKRILSNHFLVLILASLATYVAFTAWSEYLETGQVYDRRHGVVLSGNAVIGHLVGFTLLAVVPVLYLIKSIVTEAFRRKRL